MPLLGIYAASVQKASTAFESIATATGTGSSGTITFSNIPQTYQHLQLRIIARSDAASTFSRQGRLNNFNGVSTSCAFHRLEGTGSVVNASGNTGFTYMNLFRTSGASATSNVMGVAIIDIHDYASTTKNKTFRSFAGIDNNDTNGFVQLDSGVLLTTDAISSFDVIAQSGNFTTATTIALYGIKA